MSILPPSTTGSSPIKHFLYAGGGIISMEINDIFARNIEHIRVGHNYISVYAVNQLQVAIRTY